MLISLAATIVGGIGSLKVADRVVVMKAGRMVREALPAELADNAALMALY